MNYLNIDESKLEEIHEKVTNNFNKYDKNNLEKNLTGFIKPQTINNDSKNIKKKLYSDKIKNFVDEALHN